MKVLVLLSLLCCFLPQIQASVAFEIEGELECLTNVEGHFQSAFLHTPLGSAEITNLPEKFQKCTKGIFTIVENYFPEETFSILETVECLKD